MEIEIVQIEKESINLGQFLKYADIISSGGMAKPFLSEYSVYLNESQEPENRRGKKLYHGDTIEIPDVGLFKVESLAHGD